MILSAYTVETSAKGFAPCFWPVTSQQSAEALAKKLSEKTDVRYPNSFWVMDGAKAIGKWFKGCRYEPSQSI